MHHKFDKSNLILDVLSRLSIKSIKIDHIDALNIDDFYYETTIYAYNQTIVIMNDAFRVKV